MFFYAAGFLRVLIISNVFFIKNIFKAKPNTDKALLKLTRLENSFVLIPYSLLLLKTFAHVPRLTNTKYLAEQNIPNVHDTELLGGVYMPRFIF